MELGCVAVVRGPGQLRRDTPWHLGYSRTCEGHGHRRHQCVTQFPVDDVRIQRAALHPVFRRRARPGVDARLQRLAARRVVFALPDAHHPVSGDVAAGSRARGSRNSPQRRPRFSRGAFTENPERLGLSSLYSGEWDPFFAACEETDTVINLHVGSSSQTLVPSKDSPPQVLGALFPINAMQACLDCDLREDPIAVPQHQDRSVRGRHRLDLDVARAISLSASHLRRRRTRQGVGARGVHARRVAAPQLLVHQLLRPACLVAAPRDRPRSHHARIRLPARRFNMARLAAAATGVRRRFPSAEIAKLTHENAASLYRFALDPTSHRLSPTAASLAPTSA